MTERKKESLASRAHRVLREKADGLPLSVAILGAGANTQDRIMEPLTAFRDAENVRVTLGDINPEQFKQDNLQQFKRTGNVDLVKIDGDSEDQVEHFFQHHHVAVIETLHHQHPQHIMAAVRAGVPLVISEKPVADSLDACNESGVVDAVKHAKNSVVGVFSHYLGFELFTTLRVLLSCAEKPLGNLQRVDVVLSEGKGIEPSEAQAHEGGVEGLVHHAIALIGSIRGGVDDLKKQISAKYRHITAPEEVKGPTWVAALYEDDNGHVAATLRVGKYFDEMEMDAVKALRVNGSQGRAVWHRERNLLCLNSDRVRSLSRCHPDDRAYRQLVKAIVRTWEDPDARLPLMELEEAIKVLKLVEESMAVELAVNSENDSCEVLEDVPRGFGDGLGFPSTETIESFVEECLLETVWSQVSAQELGEAFGDLEPRQRKTMIESALAQLLQRNEKI